MTYTTEPKFNPFMGDYDMTVLRILNGDITYTSLREGSVLSMCLEDMREWGYVNGNGEVTPQGKRYINAWVHRYAEVSL